MLPEQNAYIFAWVDAVTAAGFRAGIYCSGMRSVDSERVITAEDIQQNAGKRNIVYWVTNDACPPSPGCAFAQAPQSRAERRELRRGLAVRAVSAAQRRRLPLHQLQPRRKLLSSRGGPQRRPLRRFKYRDVP